MSEKPGDQFIGESMRVREHDLVLELIIRRRGILDYESG
jgi:hypothetical protein